MNNFNYKLPILFTGLFWVFSLYLPNPAFAQESPSKPPTPPMSEQSFFGNTLMFMVAGFLGYYMLVTRPQQLQEQEQKGLIEKIKKNDVVLINSGILGKVIQVADDEVTVDIGTSGSNLKIKVLPSAISFPIVSATTEKSSAKN